MRVWTPDGSGPLPHSGGLTRRWATDMRSVVLEAWEEAVLRRVVDFLPQFAPYARRERGEDRGMLRFASELGPGLTGFVVFRPIQSEAFDAYVGWSTDGRCPYARAPSGANPGDLTQPRAMFPSIVLAGRSGAAHWNFWSPPDSLADDPPEFARAYAEYTARESTELEARELVCSAVEAGVREIVAYGLPYLARRVAWQP